MRNSTGFGWLGELEFEEASPDAGREWTDDGDHRDRRQLKHRTTGETRPVPMCPELSLMLWVYIKEFGTSPLAKRIYDLRHACLSLWLNSGVAPTQVAEWAGHSVEVLPRIYAKCIDGQQDIAKRRIADALRDDSDAQAGDTGTDARDDGQDPEGDDRPG